MNKLFDQLTNILNPRQSSRRSFYLLSVVNIFRKKSRYGSGRFWIKGLIDKFEQNTNLSFGKPPEEMTEEPLYLNQFIDNHNIEDGREAALVDPFCGDVKSYSGFLTVDQEKECHMFFWYFPSEKGDKDTPLLVWLNGWATPSTYGIIVQNGPYKLDENGISLREVSWHKWYNVLYIDSPLGIGYSHCPESRYSTDFKDVAKNLYWTIHYFYKLFPELHQNDLYLTGLSMGGNYITHLAKEIELANSVHKKSIKLKGLFIGNPLIGGAYQLRYHKYLHQFGFIDQNEKEIFKTLEDGIIQLVEDGKYEDAVKSIQGYLFSSNSYIKDLTGLSDLFDIRQFNSLYMDTLMKRYTDFMKKERVRNQLHVGCILFSEEVKPLFIIRPEIPKSSAPVFQTLLSKFRCLFYCGQFDAICNYPSFSDIIRDLDWSGKEQYNKVTRTKLYHHGRICGYSKSHGNLTEVMIRNAGHSVVEDQPHFALKLLHNFIQFYDLNNLPT